MKKRILATLLMLCMVVTLLPGGAMAADGVPTSGTCGENVAWQFDTASGVLTISGTGPMMDYERGVNAATAAPWVSNPTLRVGVRSVIINDGVTSIGDYAFYSCWDMTGIRIPDSVTRIGIGSFSYSGIKTVDLPDGISTIEECTFEFSEITQLTIPDGVTTIGERAFNNSKLTDVSIPGSVSRIEAHAFRHCAALKTITLPEGVTTIGTDAFFNSGLANIYIPLSAIDIADAFGACALLTDIFYAGSENDWGVAGLGSVTVDGKLPTHTWTETTPRYATIHYNSTSPGMGGVGENPDPGPGEPDNPDKVESDLSLHKIDLPFYSGLGNKSNRITLDWGWGLFEGPALTSKRYETFDERLAVTGLILSTAVEQSMSSASSVLNILDFEKVSTYDRDGLMNNPGVAFAHKSLVVNGSEQYLFVIVVRGTSNLADGLTDIYSLADGFQTSASNIQRDFDDYVRIRCGLDPDTLAGKSKFYVTGHSLGGAVANILANNLSNKYDARNVFAYTFASPKTGSDDNGASNIYNVMNSEDWVPLVPPNWGGRYGCPVWFSRKTDIGMQRVFYALTNGVSLDSLMSPSFWVGDSWNQLFYPHYTETYMSFLLLLSDDIWLNGASYAGAGSNINGNGGGGGGGVWCPVDLDIYVETDSGSLLVGRVRDNAVDETVTKGVIIRVAGDRKYFYFPFEGEYTVKLIGTDIGTMTFFAQTMDYNTGEPIKDTGTVFENVVLAPGKQFFSEFLVEGGVVTGTTTEDVKLYVSDAMDEPVKEVLPDGKGTEVPITATDEPDAPEQPSKPTTPSKPSTPSKPPSTPSKPTTPSNTAYPTTSETKPAEPQPPEPTPEPSQTPEQPPAWINPFTDVAANAWYYDAVKFVSENALMTGITATQFAPAANLTRAQLAQILYNKEGKPAAASASAFPDVASGAWYTNAVIWAAEKNIVSGHASGLFRPDDNITREQLAVMLWRYAGEPSANTDPAFRDADQVSDFAQTAIRWAVGNGILAGKGDNTLDPKGFATRAQVAQMLANYLNH